MSDVVIQTRKGPLTEAQALQSDMDMIPALCQLDPLFDFREHLDSRRAQIEHLVSRHLGIPKNHVVLDDERKWIAGSFNICLPVHIDNSRKPSLPRKAMIRFPLLFNIGESFSPGSADEKLRCEAATYIWLRENCPDVPIPRLLAMGFPGAQSFTAVENESTLNRIRWLLRRGVSWWRGEMLAPFFAHPRDQLADLGYLLIEYVQDGEMLWRSWQDHRHDEHRRSNLYRGLAKIMLDLAKVPQPRIGSWTMNDNGVLSLTNRPLSDLTFFWNRHQVPTGIPRDLTYTSTEPYVHDRLAYQDLRMRHQPNAILSEADGLYQLSALSALRIMLPRFWDQNSRNGPFVFSFTDLHQSNIFVDEHWNVTSLIDLEFACVQPIQMTCIPTWLNGRGVDQLDGPDLEEYSQLYHHFVAILEAEEKSRRLSHTYSHQLREDWKTGRLWYIKAVDSLNAFPAIVEQHLHPKFFEKFDWEIDGRALARLWDENVLDFINKKIEDRDQYEVRIKEMFAKAGRAKQVEG